MQSQLIEKFSITEAHIHDPIRIHNDVRRGTILYEQYVIENKGTDTLCIYEVTPDCTCTSYSLSTDKIAPSSFGVLTLFVDTHNRYGSNSLTTVMAMNTHEEYHFIKCNYNVTCEDTRPESSLVLGVSAISCEYVMIGEDYEFANIIKNNSPKEVGVNEVYASNDCIIVSEMPTAIEPGGVGIFRFIIRGQKLGIMDEIVAISTSLQEQSVFFRVKGKITE